MNNYYNYENNLMATSNKSFLYKQNDQNTISNTLNLNYNTDPYLGFIRGNMFDNLYNNYKNYKAFEIKPTNDKEYQQLLVQIYGFAAHDLGLYLDINPTDRNAISLRSKYIDMYNQALSQYESTYGPITQNSKMLDTMPWAWDTKKWPWEGTK